MAGKEQAMTSERLAEIRTLVDDVESARDRLTGLVIGEAQLRGDRPRAPMLAACHDLLADNERLRAREAALVAVVRAVAEFTDFVDCDGFFTQLQIEARALVASAESEQEGGGDGG